MTWIATAVVASAVLTGASVIQSRKSAKATAKANKVQRKIDDRAAKRQQLSDLRQQQIAQAAGLQAASNTGTAFSSGIQGQTASIGAVTAGNIAFSQMVQSGADVVSMYNQQATDANVLAANYQAGAQLALAAGSAFGGSPSGAETPKPQGLRK